MKITLRNDFHNTAVRLIVAPDKPPSPSQMRRSRRTLCGIRECTCSGALGVRGPQEVNIYLVGYELYQIAKEATS